MTSTKFENLLRKIETEPRILNGQKRVQIFKGEAVLQNTKITNQFSEKEIQENMEILIANGILFKAILYADNKSCNISLHKKFNSKDSYIWINEGSQRMKLFISILCILCCLLLAMYQMWPSNLRHYTIYIAYLMMAFLIFMFVLGIIRLIIFSITFFSHPPGIWLFPNLFADVGFIDSFIPLWSYHGIDTKPKKKDD